MERPSTARVTVDIVLFTIREQTLQILLIERGVEPFARCWALPGGFVLDNEDLSDAAYRELVEEAGVADGIHLEQLRSYGFPERDPRGRVVTVAWLALAPDLGEPTAGSDAAAARWWPVDSLIGGRIPLAFDHATIAADGLERARAKLEYSALATAFCPPEFTVAQLRAVYQAVWGVEIDPRNFHRKVTSTPGFIESTGGTVSEGAGRPARLFRRGQVDTLHPPLTRGGTTPSA